MKHRNYTITAEVTAYQKWELSEAGELVQQLGTENGEVTGYHIACATDPADREFFQVESSDAETLRALVDANIAERKQ